MPKSTKRRRRASDCQRSKQAGQEGRRFRRIRFQILWRCAEKGADVYVTGDVTYHTAHDIYESGLAVIDPGHYFESVCKYRLTDIFKNWTKEENWPIEVMTSRINTNPFKLI